MAESDVTSPISPTLEALQNHSRDMRRARPPDIAILKHESKVPLRQERLGKRESRLGLRNLFSKSKAGKEDKIVEEPSSSQEQPRHGGKRASLVDIGNWPQMLHSRSEHSLLASPPASLRSPAFDAIPASSRARQNSGSTINKKKVRQQTPPKPRDSITAFDPPPLFQMYPQALKHATLPTCVTSIDALARLSEPKNILLQNDFSRSNVALDQGEVSSHMRKHEAEKKKKSKFAPEWTSKIYALVTSGYLLQYAAEGAFDRLPEKILHLTRDSAAYATDLIPGKHWVIRVASTTDTDGNPATEPKSFRSKLALRGPEKRQASNMLLVFESPDAMDTWLAILRREIESLGGKKKLSETGKPEMDGETIMLKAQASQRTLIVRDPDRFSRIISQDFSWNQENALVDPNEEGENNGPPLERMSESTVDDGSSMISSDGQHLESLRDSSSSGNRLSFVSSGQRTLMSSAETSPASSPIRASFSSPGNDFLQQLRQKPLPPTPEVRPRPNAAAIINRRQSMQTMIPGFDPREIVGRPFSTMPASLPSRQENKRPFIPNFSVPHTADRRYSSMNIPGRATKPDQPQSPELDGSARPLRRIPPTKLVTSRPLSIVLDQPSPMSPYSPTASTNRTPTLQAPDSPSMFRPLASKPRPQERMDIPRTVIAEQTTEGIQLDVTTMHISHQDRKIVPDIQPDLPCPRAEMNKSHYARPSQTQSLSPRTPPEQIRRAVSSLEMRRVSTTPEFGHQSYKHTLLLAEHTSSHHRHSFGYPKQSSLSSIDEPSYTLAPPLTCSPKRSAPSLKALREETSLRNVVSVEVSPKTLSTRRSMPHLADGPPPAPPPTCALPPIPGKRSTNIPRTIKA
ncbi:hypothetical protein M426DRAFT_21807 [Hypoxylon sp. CI-4A]|nr:hypothetical protein M426DRAFT_21807 [Hypoxylon sp. CI-4A]